MVRVMVQNRGVLLAATERSPNELWVSTKAARGAVPESVKPMGIWNRLGKAQEGKNKTKAKESTIKHICGFYPGTFLSLLEKEGQLFQELKK